MTLFVIIMLIALIWINFISNHIPKMGRDADARGEEITAVITNCNKTADKAAVLRAEADGRKFKVKLKPTEAHLWIKGDNIKIILSENKKTYRVLFNDYFRANEQRIKEHAINLLEKKINTNLIAARSVKYTSQSLDDFKNSKMESQRIFTFVSLMRIIDIYTIVGIVMGAAFVIWFVKTSPAFKDLILPVALILIMIWMLNSAINTCKHILKEVQKTEKA